LKKFTENDTPLKRSTVPRAGVVEFALGHSGT